MSTKKERKPITLHHVHESHVVEIDNITRVQVTPLSYGQQGIKLALTHRMMDDMDLSLAAKRTDSNLVNAWKWIHQKREKWSFLFIHQAQNLTSHLYQVCSFHSSYVSLTYVDSCVDIVILFIWFYFCYPIVTLKNGERSLALPLPPFLNTVKFRK